MLIRWICQFGKPLLLNLDYVTNAVGEDYILRHFHSSAYKLEPS